MKRLHPNEEEVGKWPVEFHGKTIDLVDEKSKEEYQVELAVKEVGKEEVLKNVEKGRIHLKHNE